MQLAIIGRHKYVQSVMQLAREEKERERRELAAAASSLWFWGSSEPETDYQSMEMDPMDENTEAKFLSLSWWLLHVGWKDVKERVRRSVEDVFEK